MTPAFETSLNENARMHRDGFPSPMEAYLWWGIMITARLLRFQGLAGSSP